MMLQIKTLSSYPGRRSVIIAITLTTTVVIARVVTRRNLFRSIATKAHDVLPDRVFSRLLQMCSSNIDTDYRKLFKQQTTETAVEHTVINHSHLVSATDRCRANTAANTFIAVAGFDPYSVSMSGGENGKIAGTRYYHVAKDLQDNYVHDTLTAKHILRLTDVDYYVDMPSLLTGRHLIIYSFVPEASAGSTSDGVYSTNADNTITLHVNGGATYTHALWDYDTDHLVIDFWWGSTVYLVEHKRISADRRLIFFNHVRTVIGPLGWVLPGKRLSRRHISFGDYAYIRSQFEVEGKTLMHHSISLIGSTTSLTIADSVFYTCWIRYKMAKNPAISDLERIINQTKNQDAPFVASVLHTVFGTATFAENISKTTKISPCIVPTDNVYQTLFPLITEDGDGAMRTLLDPLSQTVAQPARSYNNDNACIEGRVRRVKNQVTSYPPFYYNCMTEFLSHMIPAGEAQSLAPTDFDAQWSQFKRPSQRGFIRQVAHVMFFPRFFIKSFQKAESYGKVTDPRNISTLPMDHNFKLGQFSTALVNQYFKPAHWYAFGKHPRVFSARLNEMVQGHTQVVATDLSKCDGSTGLIHYNLTVALVTRAFHPRHHKEIFDLLRKEANGKGVTSHGLRYDTQYNTLSGSSMTSWRNSIINAFTNYVALRYTMDSTEAYRNLGLYGGDDGVSICVEPATLEKVFAKMGMLLKAELVAVGQPLGFLGRLYIDPWTTTESIIDIKRQMAKFHLTATPAIVPTNVALRRKAEAYLVTDPDTPVVAHWSRYILRNYAAATEGDLHRCRKYLNVDTYWWSRANDHTDEFETPFPPIMDHNATRDLACANLGITPDKLDAIITMLDNDVYPVNIMPDPPRIEIPVAMNGIIQQPLEPRDLHRNDHQAAIKSKAKRAIRPHTKTPTVCRHFLKGQCNYKNCKFAHIKRKQ